MNKRPEVAELALTREELMRLREESDEVEVVRPVPPVWYSR